MKTYNLVIANGENKQLDVSGNFFKLIVATGALLARVDQRGNSGVLCDRLEVVKGDKVGFRADFDRLTFKNESGGSVTAEVIIGAGDHVSTILTTRSDVKVSQPAGLEHTADNFITPGQKIDFIGPVGLAPGGGQRAVLILQADPSNPGEVRVGASYNVGATSGLKLYPGETLTLETSQYPGVYNPQATDCVVRAIYIYHPPE